MDWTMMNYDNWHHYLLLIKYFWFILIHGYIYKCWRHNVWTMFAHIDRQNLSISDLPLAPIDYMKKNASYFVDFIFIII